MDHFPTRGFSVEVDTVGKAAWSEIIHMFSDATLYQTWSYGTIRWGEKTLSHLIVRKDGDIVAGAQVAIVKTPLLNAGIAYILGGPLWRLRARKPDTEILRQTIQALSQEYSVSRRLHLRIFMKIPETDSKEVLEHMNKQGFSCNTAPSSGRTFLINLQPSLTEHRQALQRQWRNNLKKAEKNGLQVLEGNSDELYNLFTEIYHEMHTRKRFVEHVDIDEYRLIQSDLPDQLKMHVMVCTDNGRLSSALVCSALGDTAINLLAATSKYDIENRLNGSHLLFWKMLEWAKSRGCYWYDLGGINPERNPGGYQFKGGLAGKAGIDTHAFEQFDSSMSILSSAVITCSDYLRMKKNRLKEAYAGVGTER